MTWVPPPDGPWSPGDPASLGAVAWQPPGAGPYNPAPVLPPPPPPAGRPRRRALLAGVVALIVIVLGATIGIAIGVGGDSPSATAESPSPGVPPPSAAATSQAAATAARSAAVSATPSTPAQTAVPSQTYSGPGGISVSGPVGWVPDTSAGVPTVADYRPSSSPQRLLGATFRIGIGNPSPGASFDIEVQQSIVFLQTNNGATILGTSRGTFLGVPAADIQYDYFNAGLGVQRHGIERLWRSNGVTMIIQSSDVDANWPAASAVFAQLVASASVS